MDWFVLPHLMVKQPSPILVIYRIENVASQHNKISAKSPTSCRKTFLWKNKQGQSTGKKNISHVKYIQLTNIYLTLVGAVVVVIVW